MIFSGHNWMAVMAFNKAFEDCEILRYWHCLDAREPEDARAN